ncbi:MAG TPA: DUF4384 domain-containing protein [Pyrinomonadaceae bacterium]|nr:DUF4384 domain-containing protein [Pyrinomonadaceae bacterium]
MRLSVMVSAFVCLCAVVIGIAAQVQDGDDVRGAFLTSRPKEKKTASSGAAAKPSRRRPKSTVPATTNKPPEKSTSTPATTSDAGTAASTPSKPVNTPRIGLGLTLFMRDSTGLAVRTDPDHVFRSGDRVRVLLETNADGYLYIFNTTNDGPAVMIYPDAQLDEAGNYIQAHVPFEIPSSQAAEEKLRWFAFDDVGGTERVFFVFTREPLKGIPIEDELIALCRDSKESCPVKPSSEVWAEIKKELQEPLKRDKVQKIGGAETDAEQQATTRGLGLAKSDPQPSLVMMASSPRSTLVATLDLIHK